MIFNKSFPQVVNLSVTSKCNYKCKFCFGQFKDLLCWPDDHRILEIPRLLSKAGTEKLTFTGGGPFLYLGLEQLLIEAKKSGLTTSIVTNGSLVTKERLERIAPCLDWLAISIDSSKESTEITLGRGTGNHVANAIKISNWTHELGIHLKTNTVVTKLNYKEDISALLISLKPERAKLFQVLPIHGENNDFINELVITYANFMKYTNRQKSLEEYGIQVISETSNDMIGSYAMILPNGVFFNNYWGKHVFGEHSIFDVDPEQALFEVGWEYKKFLKRGGLYNWNMNGGNENVKRK